MLALVATIATLILTILMFVAENSYNLLILVIPFGGLAIYQSVLFFDIMGNRIIIYLDGISITQRGNKHLFRWDEIDKVYTDKLVSSSISSTSIDAYRLHHSNGTEVILNSHYKKFYLLGRLIHQAVTRCQIPLAIETLKSGKPLDFGTLYVTKDGIHFHDKKKSWIPWAEVGYVTSQQDFIRVNNKKKWTDGQWVRLSNTANPHLFYKLVDDVDEINSVLLAEESVSMWLQTYYSDNIQVELQRITDSEYASDALKQKIYRELGQMMRDSPSETVSNEEE